MTTAALAAPYHAEAFSPLPGRCFRLGKRVEIPIGLVTLSAAGESVCLSDIVVAVRRFARRLERAAAAAFSTLPDTLGAQARFDLPID
jgi:hypothetical protein